MPLLVPIAAAAAFGALLGLDAGGWGPLAAADRAVSSTLLGYGRQHPDLIAFTRVATDIATTWLYLAVGLLSALVLSRRGRRREARFVALVTVAVPVAWSLLHLWLYSPRPTGGFVELDTNGFPSGHTSNAAAATLVAVLLLWPRLGPAGRLAAALAATAFPLFVGLTRMLLLAHWPTDVLGGALLALTIVPAAARLTGVPDRFGPVAR